MKLYTALTCYLISISIAYSRPTLQDEKQTRPNVESNIQGSNSVARGPTNETATSNGTMSRASVPVDQYEPIETNVDNPFEFDFLDKTFQELYSPGFITSLPNLCPDNGSSIPLVIIILSAPENVEQRNVLRNIDSYIPYGRKNNVPIAFMVGISDDYHVDLLVAQESFIYKDIIINQNIDDYLNLPLKIMAILEWFQTYCSKAAYILKTDDDVKVSVRLLLQFVKKRTHVKKAIYGRLSINMITNRNENSRNYISKKEYNGTYLPHFTLGSRYLMTSDVPATLFKAALTQKFVGTEDVFFTGMIAQKVGVRRVPSPQFPDEIVPLKMNEDNQNVISVRWCELGGGATERKRSKREEREEAKLKEMWKEVSDDLIC